MTPLDRLWLRLLRSNRWLLLAAFVFASAALLMLMNRCAPAPPAPLFRW